MTLYTLGYEGLDIVSFIGLLKRNGVVTVIDVRERAQSRKAGFSKKSLTNALAMAGIGYRHMPELGCPKPVRDQYRLDGNWPNYVEGFIAYLETAGESVTELAAAAKDDSCVLVCYEADHNYCHRSMVAIAVQAETGLTIKHIGKTTSKTVRADRYQHAMAAGAGR